MTNPGDGTVARPYEIQDVNQLESLMDRPDLGGMHFVLTADIDLAGKDVLQGPDCPGCE